MFCKVLYHESYYLVAYSLLITFCSYRIEFAPGEFGDDSKQKLKNDSSSDSDDDDHHKTPVININMKGYGY